MSFDQNKRFARSLLCICAVLSLGIAACGGKVSDVELTGSTHEALSSDAGLITISGAVTDASGNPSTNGDVIVTLTGSAQKMTTASPFTGQYSFSVAPGSYSVSAGNTCITFTPSVANLNNLKANATVNFVGSGSNQVTNCEALSGSGGTSGPLTLSGHLTSAGNPVVGAKVSLSGSTQGFRYADESGAYTFSVSNGSYTLSVAGACASYSPSVANLNNIKTSKTQDFTGSGNCPPAPLTLCPTFDSDFQLSALGDVCVPNLTTNNCIDRIGYAFSIIASDPAITLTDCRFGQFASLLGTDPAFTETIVQLENFILYFLGCPYVGTEVGTLTDGLIPAVLTAEGFHFTTADVQALSDDLVLGFETALASIGAPALTSAQISSIESALTFLQSNTPGLVHSSTFTFSTCGDAGH
jgi:hypothetical protein